MASERSCAEALRGEKAKNSDGCRLLNSSSSSSLVIDLSALLRGDFFVPLGDALGDLGERCLRLLRRDKDLLVTIPGGSWDRSSTGGRAGSIDFRPRKLADPKVVAAKDVEDDVRNVILTLIEKPSGITRVRVLVLFFTTRAYHN